MSSETRWSDNNSTLICFVMGISMVAGSAGYYFGSNSVTDAARRSAANEAMYEIVRLVEEPSENMTILAERSCRSEFSSKFDTCMITFLREFAAAYVVNMMSGDYVLIGGEGRKGETE